MKHVYLDQNQWSYLSLALRGEPRTPEDAAAGEAVKRSVADGTASFPLATAHVFETWKQHRADKRQPLAQTMMEISRNDAIASPQQLLPPELDQALHRRFGRPDRPADVHPFGRGLRHLSGGVAPDPDRELVHYLRELHPDLDDIEITDWIDALLLAGPDENLPTADVGQPDLQFGEGFAAAQAELQRRFKQDGTRKDEIRRAVAVSMLMDIKEPLEAALGRAAVTLDEFTALGRQGLTDFMFDLPSRVALLELTWRQHADLQTKWKPNDLNDLVYLSAAIGYCDIVVTERRWNAMLAQIDVRLKTGTTVLGKLADLPEALKVPDLGS
ncbi:MAG: hypothetical protein ACLP0J_15190 [Solirubrobacteraceae bacterium]